MLYHLLYMCAGGKSACERMVTKKHIGPLTRVDEATGGKWELKRTSKTPGEGPPNGSDGDVVVVENDRLGCKS